MDLLKTSILTLYLMGGYSLTHYSNYKNLPLLNGLSLLAGSLFGFFQFEKIRSVYFIRPVLKTLMFFGINTKKVTLPIIRFANALNQSAYGGFFLRPFFQPVKKLNMDFETVAAKVKEKIPEDFNPKLVLKGMLSMKVFIENISWLGLSTALSVGMLYSSNNTVANLRKKAIITPQDVHRLVKKSSKSN